MSLGHDVLEAIIDKDLVRLKYLIPDKAAYDKAVNGKAPSFSNLKEIPVIGSFNVDRTQNKAEKIFMESLFFTDSLTAFSHLSSIGAVSDIVAFSFLQQSVSESNDFFIPFLLDNFQFTARQHLEVLQSATRRSSNEIILTVLDGTQEDSLDKHKEFYTEIVSRIAQWISGPHQEEILTPLLKAYPGKITDDYLLVRTQVPARDLDLSFEKMTSLYPISQMAALIDTDNSMKISLSLRKPSMDRF